MRLLTLPAGQILAAAAAIALALLAAERAEACDPSDTAYVNRTAKIVNVEAENATVKHTVGGQVTVLSGCTFQVRFFGIVPSGDGVYWYGVPNDPAGDLVPRVVPAALGSFNGQLVKFDLDPMHKFSDFSIISIYSEGDQRAYGAFSLGGNLSSYYKIDNSKVSVDTNPFAESSGDRLLEQTVVSMILSFCLVVLFVV